MVGVAAFPYLAAAQVAGPDEVIVTAQHREQRLQDTPLAITVLSAADLDARIDTTVAGVSDRIPNATLKVLGSSFGPALGAAIRGVGQFDFNPALEPGVGLYVDDVYFPTLTGADLELLDVERIEILRGPQGTIAGRNAIGGAIKIVSRRPGTAAPGFVEATYGSGENVGVRGGLEFLLGQAATRVSFVGKQQNGYVKRFDYGCLFGASGVPAQRAAGNCLAGRDGGVGYVGARGSSRLNLSDTIDLTITADYGRDKRTPAAEVLTVASLNNPNTNPAPNIPFDSRFICGAYCNYANNAQPAGQFVGGASAGFPLNATSGSDRSLFRGHGFSADLDVALSPTLSLRTIAAYRRYKSTFNSDDDLSPANIGYGQNRLDHDFKSGEVRLTGDMTDAVSFTAGAYASTQRTTYFTYQDIRYAPIPLQFVGDDPVDADTQALFASVVMELSASTNVTGGLRYTHEAKDYTFVRQNRDGTANPFLGALSGVVGRYRGSHTDYRIGIDHRWNATLMTYASIATGFKGGGIGPRPFNAAQVQAFGPEKLTAYEIGLKADVFNGRARFNVSAFHNDYTALQLTLNACPQFGGPGPCALPQNAGDADVEGVEVEAVLRPAARFTIDAAASFLDFDYVSINAATGLPLSGTQPYLPRRKWSLGASYDIELSNLGTLTSRVSIAHQDDVFTNPVNRAINQIPAYTVADASIVFRHPATDAEVGLFIGNLTDKYYYLTIFDITGAGAGTVKAQPARGREYAVRIRKSF
jgi:iron complex outermembrane receptor protein